jgi:hypothetical protein
MNHRSYISFGAVSWIRLNHLLREGPLAEAIAVDDEPARGAPISPAMQGSLGLPPDPGIATRDQAPEGVTSEQLSPSVRSAGGELE